MEAPVQSRRMTELRVFPLLAPGCEEELLAVLSASHFACLSVAPAARRPRALPGSGGLDDWVAPDVWFWIETGLRPELALRGVAAATQGEVERQLRVVFPTHRLLEMACFGPKGEICGRFSSGSRW
jgi:hypothetical protein